MPVRLTGLWAPSARAGRLDSAFEALLAGLPVQAGWTRVVRRWRTACVVVDVCGLSTHRHALGDAIPGTSLVGGIRLDQRLDAVRALGEPAAEEVGDAEIAARAFRRWGLSAFDRLHGDFAFALCNEADDSLYLVRDPFGTRRLHFAVSGGVVAFSTEVEGVLAWPGIDRTPDDVTILDNLLGRYLTRTRTFFRAIKRVVPGHFVHFHGDEVRDEGQQQIRFATPPTPEPPLRSLTEYGDAFRDALDAAVAERLPRTGAVACHVSGGLDSTFVACTAAARLTRDGRPTDLALVTARFPGLRCDEGDVAAQVAAWTKLSLHEWDGTRPDLSDLDQPRCAWPFGRSSIGGSVQGDLDLAGSAGAPVVLSGIGGNQLSDEWDYLADVWREDGMLGMLPAVAKVLRGRPWRAWASQLRRVAGQARCGFVPPRVLRRQYERHDAIFRAPPDWLGPRLREVWRTLVEETVVAPRDRPVTGSWTRDWSWQAMTNDPRHVWTLEHEEARACERGLEIRFPYLSWSLLKLVMSVPWRLREPAPGGRVLHRNAMKGVVPESVRTRQVPVWFTEAVVLNCQKAESAIQQTLRPGGRLGDFVRIDEVTRILGSSATRKDEIATYNALERWQFLRDLAALDAWLARLSC